MLEQKKTTAQLLNLKEGKTTEDVMLAILDSDLLEQNPVESMHQAGIAAFNLLSQSNNISLEIKNAFYPIEKLFNFYYELASDYSNRKKTKN
jgi:hypothetical protein